MRRSSILPLCLVAALSIVSPSQGLAQGRFVQLRPMPFSNAEAGGGELDGLIYLVGGFNDESALMIYDPKRDTWERGRDIPQPVHHPAVRGFEGKLYVIGGHSAESLVHVYDPETDQWTVANGRVPTPRRAMAIVELNGRLHVIGGTSGPRGGGGHVEHEAYDPVTDSWQKLAPLLEPRDHGYAGVIDDKIYFASGRLNFILQPELQIYDPKSNSWSFGPPLLEAVSGHAVQVVDNRLYAMGGEDVPNDGVTRRAQRYDPFAGIWENMTEIPKPLHAAANAAYKGSIYLFGGVDVVEGSSRGLVDVWRFDPPLVRNPAPAKLKAKALDSTTVRLKWRLKRKISDATSQQVQVRLAGRDWKELSEEGIRVQKLVVSELKSGATYTFRVRTNGPLGPSEWSNERTVTLPE